MVSKVVVISIVGVVGGLAFIFGIVGSFSGVKDGSNFRYATDLSYCVWDSTPAAGLGIVGCIFMLFAQIFSNVMGGCVCCCTKQPLNSSSKIVAILCLTLSWILTTLSSIFLFVGGVNNAGSMHMQLDVYTDGDVVCYGPSNWPFIAGGVLSLFATGTAICFYIIATSNVSPTNNYFFGQNNNFNIQMHNANGIPNAATVPAAGSYQAGVPSPGYY